MANLEGVAQRWYSDERISHDGDDGFVEMMLLDGCFILELVWKINHPTQSTDGILSGALFIDLLGIENQVPFFILVELFHKTNSNSGASSKFNDLAQRLTDFVILFCDSKENEYVVDDGQVIHLLDLVYKAWTFSYAAKFIALGPWIREDDPFSLYHITSASELQEINGVEFEDSGKGPWLEIIWENGVVKIPRFMVHVDTERLLRNLILYEQHYTRHHEGTREYINDYAIFMGSLINSSRDVEVLRNSRIITNKLNDDQAVSTMFRRVYSMKWKSMPKAVGISGGRSSGGPTSTPPGPPFHLLLQLLRLSSLFSRPCMPSGLRKKISSNKTTKRVISATC
nr:UPF0481 protein At3g47200-like [Coffea arabica]